MRLAFRFCFVYFGLYVVTTQMLRGMFPFKVPFFDLGKWPPMRNLVMWTGHNLLHVKPILAPTGSGDTMYDWDALGHDAWSGGGRHVPVVGCRARHSPP